MSFGPFNALLLLSRSAFGILLNAFLAGHGNACKELPLVCVLA